MSDKSIRKSISLYPDDWHYIEEHQKQFNMGRSNSIRYLINDHKRLKNTYESSQNSKP